MRSRLQRLSERDWRTFDKVIVAVLIVVATVDVATTAELEGPLALNIAVMDGIALSFLWRRSRPLLTALATIGGLMVMGVFLTQPPNLLTAVVMLVIAGYADGRHLAGRRSVVGMLIGVVAIVTLSIIYDPGDIFFPVTFFWIIPWVAGRTIRNQTMLARELAEKAEHAQHAREEDERRAIALERSRIGRELHDVLAHNLSVMVVQAAAARRVVDRNPDQAIEVAALIERTGREALAEIRHLFGAVRRGEGQELSGPPSIGRVDELAQRARAAGLRVELRVLGSPVELPAGIDLTAYRIVQEALTNTLKHAGNHVRTQVVLDYRPAELRLSISDDGPPARPGNGARPAGAGPGAGSGRGLIGMRERVGLLGGVLDAGPRAGTGYRVHATIPM
jgi:signal transduction histidine kinase